MLLNLAGAIANINGNEQFYIYDAYGNLLNMAASAAATTLLYSGEQFDSRIGQQYLRARYYDPNSGRFNRLDPFFGNHSDPQSFHKYLYTHADPVNGIDPSGLMSLSGQLTVGAIGAGLGALTTSAVFHSAGRSPAYGGIVGALGGASLVYSYFRGILPRVLGEAFLAATIVVVSEMIHDYIVAPNGQNAQHPINYVARAIARNYPCFTAFFGFSMPKWTCGN